MRWLIFAVAFSVIISEWYGKDFLRKNWYFIQRRKNNVVYLLCAVFGGVQLFRASCSIYNDFPNHISNLFGWFFLTAGVIRLFSYIWGQLFEKVWHDETGAVPRYSILCSFIRMGIGLLIWSLIFYTFGRGEALRFQIGEGIFGSSVISAITGFLSWVWTDPRFPVWRNRRAHRIVCYLYIRMTPLFAILLFKITQGAIYGVFSLKAFAADLLFCTLGEIVLICIGPAYGKIMCCFIIQLITLLVGIVRQFLIKEIPVMVIDIYSNPITATITEGLRCPLTLGFLEGIVLFQALWIVFDFCQINYYIYEVSSKTGDAEDTFV